MNGLIMLVISSLIFLAAYFIYGRYLEKTWGIDEKRPTPAHEFADGVDYVASKKGVVFGHAFASIAGAGPINGPIIAAIFGWVPVLLWIIIGGIFFGAVHDFAALYASVKNKGKTIGYIIELYIGKTGKKLFLLFVWLFSLLVIAAFADIVAGTFNGFGPKIGSDLITANASVATTSIMFIIFAVLIGFFNKYYQPSSLLGTIVSIILLILAIYIGLNTPIYLTRQFWLYFVFAYIFIASITPVWILLQPRDYLNSFLLVAMIAGAFIGIIFTNPAINITPFAGFEVNGNHMFPILFVTVACGAISGFHSLVDSGTVSKQIDNERDMLPVSFGAMLVECLLAVIALIAVGAIATGGVMPKGTPPVIFATAISGFLTQLGLPEATTFTIITLAISAFALTSLDSVARVGRLAFQEFFYSDEKVKQAAAIKVFSNKYFATSVTLFFGYLLSVNGYQKIWPLFGSANQLLAALALIACAVFLRKTQREGFMLYVPMFAMLLITFTALSISIYKLFSKMGTGVFNLASDGLQLVLALLLLALGILVANSGIKKLFIKND